MDVLITVQGKISSSALVCCEQAGLSTLAPYRGKYLKTRWQTSKRCKTVTQDLCPIQPCHSMGCQDQPQWQGGTGTGMCCSLWDVWKDTGGTQGREQGERDTSQEIPWSLQCHDTSKAVPYLSLFPHLTWFLVLPNFNTSPNTSPTGQRALQKSKISEKKESI